VASLFDTFWKSDLTKLDEYETLCRDARDRKTGRSLAAKLTAG